VLSAATQVDAPDHRMSKKRGPGRPRKRGRPKKAPGEPVDHRLTPKIRIAILAIVEDNAPRAHAAKLAGLTDDAVRKAMKDNPAAREFYTNEVRALMQFAKAKAAHALIKELDGASAAARVAAARTILEDNERSPAANNMPLVPGFAILIADTRSPQVLPAGPVLDQIALQPAQSAVPAAR
jgi:hypothetical protein